MTQAVPAPASFPVTVDIVALTVRGGELCVLLITRLIEPFRGRLALPGGFVLPGEDLVEAAIRELGEETGVERLPGYLEQLASYGPKGRDPRGDVLTVAHLLLAPDFPVIAAQMSTPVRCGSACKSLDELPLQLERAVDEVLHAADLQARFDAWRAYRSDERVLETLCLAIDSATSGRVRRIEPRPSN